VGAVFLLLGLLQVSAGVGIDGLDCCVPLLITSGDSVHSRHRSHNLAAGAAGPCCCRTAGMFLLHVTVAIIEKRHTTQVPPTLRGAPRPEPEPLPAGGLPSSAISVAAVELLLPAASTTVVR
jgi:hypothetical protein